MNIVSYYIILLVILVVYGFITNKIYKLEIGSNKNLNLFLIILITIVIFTLFSIQLNRILSKKANKIKPPIGINGYRGIRGSKGDNASNCKCDDSICYKKVMEYITLVYNEWCSITGNTQLASSKFIKNNFIKQKVKQMCNEDTSQFNLLLDKHGSNKFPYYYFADGLGKFKPCDINSNCGAYDYLFAKWREWILIILKYERGKYFLDSEDLTDIDFVTIGRNGMITENDMKADTAKRYKCEWIFKNPLIFPNISVSYVNKNLVEYDDWFKNYLIEMDPSNGDKRYNIYNNKKNLFLELDKNQKDNPKSLEQLREAYKEFTLEISQYVISLEYFTEYFQKNVAIKNVKKPFFKLNNLKRSPFYDFYNIPGVPSAIACKSNSVKNIMSPFDVIKHFDAWYWGAPSDSRPKLIPKCDVSSEYIDYSEKPSIKIKLTNNYKKIWSNSKLRQAKLVTHDLSNIIIPFQDVGRSLVDQHFEPLQHPTISDEYVGVDIFIGENYTDMEEESLKYKYYYPVGCVVVPNNFNVKNDRDKCHPKTQNNRELDNNLTNGPQICTLLVSGDVVEPIGYNRLFIRKRIIGTMKNEIGYSFWRPIAPEGYVALGDVISTNIDGTPPSTNLIRCVPKYCLEENFIYSDETLLDIYTTNSKFNKIKNEPTHIGSINYDTDYNPSIKEGNFENINLVQNINKINPDLDYTFISENNSISDTLNYASLYNIFRVCKSDDSLLSTNNIDSIKSLFYMIKLTTIVKEIENMGNNQFNSSRIVNNLVDSKYSIMNLYASEN